MIVTVYTKLPDAEGGCVFCWRAQQWLMFRGIPFLEVRLDKEQRQKFYDRMGLVGNKRTVPQVTTRDDEGGNEDRIGGYEELVNSRLETLFGRGLPLPRQVPSPSYEVVKPTVIRGNYNYAKTEPVEESG